MLTAGVSRPQANARMVPVFRMPIPEAETISADKDVIKREEQLRTLLAERGALRLLGAVAGAELAESIAVLDRTHPNCSAATAYVLGEEALARQKGDALCGMQILLAGPAGVGKTDYALALARLLGVPAQVISMSNAQSSAAIGGSESHYINSKPGVVFDVLTGQEYANPIFVLDELEKSTSHWGDPLGALYQLLEQKTAAAFRDKSVPWLELDCSRVNWVATVNDPQLLHPAIRSRFTEIAVTAPSDDEHRALVQSLYVQLLDEFGLIGRFPSRLGTASQDALMGVSIRDVKRRLRAALALALRQEKDEVVVTAEPTGAHERRVGFV